MNSARILHNNLIRGKLNKLVFDEKLYDTVRWVYNFAMLRHEHYALRWEFNLKEEEHEKLNDIALYSLIINKHDDKAKKIMDKYIEYNTYINFNNVLSIARPEWLTPASKNMSQLLLDLFPDNASINYVVTSWSIMSNYDIKNLKYGYDHNATFKYCNKEIPNHRYEIKTSCNVPSVVLDKYASEFSGDYSLDIVDKKCFDRLWNELDLNYICDVGTDTDWGSSLNYDILISGIEDEEEF